MTEPTHDEAHGGALGARLNWLRAAVLGANDGIVSTAGLVVGVAGATSDRAALLTAGLAGARPRGVADGGSGGPAGRIDVHGGRRVRVRVDPARLRDGRAGGGEKGVEGT